MLPNTFHLYAEIVDNIRFRLELSYRFITRTNSMSVSSERSSQSFPSLRQRLIANASTNG